MRIDHGVIAFLIILVMLLATQCQSAGTLMGSTNTPVPTVVDTGLAHGVPCRPPCWENLIPGETTRQVTELILGQLCASGKVYDVYLVPTGFNVYRRKSNTMSSINGRFEDDVLQWIEGDVEFDYTIRTLIEQFGSPEAIYLPDRGSTVCSNCEGWDAPEVPTVNAHVYFFYPSRGIQFLIFVPGGGGCICPEMRIVTFWFYAPTSIQEALNSFNQFQLESYPGAEFKRVTMDNLIQWHGFGGGY